MNSSGVILTPECMFSQLLRMKGPLGRRFLAGAQVSAGIEWPDFVVSHQLLSIPPWQSFCTAASVADDRGPSAAQVHLEGFNASRIGYKDSD